MGQIQTTTRWYRALWRALTRCTRESLHYLQAEAHAQVMQL